MLFDDPTPDEVQDMADVQRFEEKVLQALRDVMKHAVAGHERGYNSFCNDPSHALHILTDSSIRPVNAHVVERVLPHLDK